jgi:hypothetical protein
MFARSIRGTRRSGAVSHEGFLRYARHRWAKIAAVVAAVAILIYAIDNPMPRPGGGTAYGYTLGIASTLLILWLALLGIRKRRTTAGSRSLSAWTSAHVYLGLALVVTATLHTGFQFGWNVHTLAYVLVLLVVVSGLTGIGFYAMLPSALSDNRGEMTQRQMITALHTLDRQIQQAAQSLGERHVLPIRAALAEDPFDAGLFRRLSGRFTGGATREAIAAIRAMRSGPPHAIDPLLEKRASMLERIRRHMHLKALLEAWLYVHIPATIALLVALTAHIVAVFFYW